MSRYFQQNIVSEIGFEGQIKLKNARVLVIGAGGLGTPVATLLAASGIGTIGIADGDSIEITNLHRQFLYDESEIGQQKVEIISNKLKKQNPDIEIIKIPFHLTIENIEKIVSNFNIICDCTDNLKSRILIDSYSSKYNKPLIYAAVKDWEGYITILNHKKNIRLTDVFSTKSLIENAENNCSVSGIVNTTCNIAGSIQANEVIKIILDLENQLDGEILCFNSYNVIFKKYKILI